MRTLQVKHFFEGRPFHPYSQAESALCVGKPFLERIQYYRRLYPVSVTLVRSYAGALPLDPTEIERKDLVASSYLVPAMVQMKSNEWELAS